MSADVPTTTAPSVEVSSRTHAARDARLHKAGLPESSLRMARFGERVDGVRASSGATGEASRPAYLPPQPVSLRRLTALSRLSAAEEQLVRGLKPTTVAQGTDLSSAREPYFILSGWGARKVGRGADARIGLILLPGDSIGLQAPRWAIDDMPPVALTPLIVAQAGEVRQALANAPLAHPGLVKACRCAVLREQAFCFNAIFRLGQQSAAERVAHFLLELRMRLGEVGLVAAETFALPVSQAVMAEALGLSLVHLNRTLRAMRAQGLIEMRSGQVRLASVERLSALSGFTPTALDLDLPR